MNNSEEKEAVEQVPQTDSGSDPSENQNNTKQSQDEQNKETHTPVKLTSKEPGKFYRVRFRDKRQVHSCVAKIHNLAANEIVMVQTDHGLEPSSIIGSGAVLPLDQLDKVPARYTIVRRASRDEVDKYTNLMDREKEAFEFCQKRIEGLGLVMKLIIVERYFNGSKIIFYFTAENRVDFRALVKDLVQEFRTRVEMRQIGVRHETQMLGGLGCCGRELCCSQFMTKFVPVSIKMAKEQDLPLNPSKISGACNRLLCCLTHEFETYKALKKNMPRAGKTVSHEDKLYKVSQCNTLKEQVTLVGIEDRDDVKVLGRDHWPNISIINKQKKQNTPEGQKTLGKQKGKKAKGQHKGQKGKRTRKESNKNNKRHKGQEKAKTEIQ